MGETPSGAEEHSSPGEEGVEAKVCDELIITLVPHPPAPLRKQRNWGQS